MFGSAQWHKYQIDGDRTPATLYLDPGAFQEPTCKWRQLPGGDMSGHLPIIYVRGYAGGAGAVENTVNLPYYGFNLGSTQVRTGPDGDPDFFIFESPLVRLMKDHGYADIFARVDEGGAVRLLNGEQDRYPH
jgi:hypothetical protein